MRRPVVKGLVKLGVVVEEEAPRDLPYPVLDSKPPLSPRGGSGGGRGWAGGVGRGQCVFGHAAEGGDRIGQDRGLPEAVAECLRAGRQALVLLPEIALTADFLARVEGGLARARLSGIPE